MFFFEHYFYLDKLYLSPDVHLYIIIIYNFLIFMIGNLWCLRTSLYTL